MRVGISNKNGTLTESGDSGNAPKPREYDNTLVMSFVEQTRVLTLTGEEVCLRLTPGVLGNGS